MIHADVGPEGGKIAIDNISIDIPSSAVDETKGFDFEVHGDEAECCPDGNIAITHKIACR